MITFEQLPLSDGSRYYTPNAMHVHVKTDNGHTAIDELIVSCNYNNYHLAYTADPLGQLNITISKIGFNNQRQQIHTMSLPITSVSTTWRVTYAGVTYAVNWSPLEKFLKSQPTTPSQALVEELIKKLNPTRISYKGVNDRNKMYEPVGTEIGTLLSLNNYSFLVFAHQDTINPTHANWVIYRCNNYSPNADPIKSGTCTDLTQVEDLKEFLEKDVAKQINHSIKGKARRESKKDEKEASGPLTIAVVIKALLKENNISCKKIKDKKVGDYVRVDSDIGTIYFVKPEKSEEIEVRFSGLRSWGRRYSLGNPADPSANCLDRILKVAQYWYLQSKELGLTKVKPVL